MKLFTEEQVKVMLIKTDQFTPLHIDHLMDELTPIKLPSNDEIWDRADEIWGRAESGQSDVRHLAFMQSAKWMRDKIQGGNK
jgi:hypothetical protein